MAEVLLDEGAACCAPTRSKAETMDRAGHAALPFDFSSGQDELPSVVA
jgi:hypothetical protein